MRTPTDGVAPPARAEPMADPQLGADRPGDTSVAGLGDAPTAMPIGPSPVPAAT